MNTVFIGGSRHVSRLSQEVKERLRNVTDLKAHILVGDANGADKAVQKFLHDDGYPHVTVYCSGHDCRNNLGGWPTENIEATPEAKGFHFYAAKDRVMARKADYGLMIWDGKSPGTVLNILRLVQSGKKALLLNVPEKTTVTFKSPLDWERFITQANSTLRSDLGKRATADEMVALQVPLQTSFLDKADAPPVAAAPSTSEEDVAAEINAALATGDAASVVDALGNVARARGMSQVAKETGLARESLYRSLGSGGNPEFTTVFKVLSSMGLRLMVGKANDKGRGGRA
jgi:probable addiction module antidote protein